MQGYSTNTRLEGLYKHVGGVLHKPEIIKALLVGQGTLLECLLV